MLEKRCGPCARFSPGAAHIRILLLEDSPADAELVELELRRLGDIEIFRVSTELEYLRVLAECRPTVILSDHSTGGFSSFAAMRLARESCPAAPFIILSGHVDEQRVVAAVRQGADDVLSKDHLYRLRDAIRSALSHRARLASLTPRQLEVLRLVVNGETTPSIAARLNVSVKTIETHRAEIMRRLGIHDLTGVVRYGVRVGLVPGP